MKRYPVYRASTARISRILGALGVPVSLVAVLGHRFGLMGVPDMSFAIVMAAGLGVLAIVLAIWSLVRLWQFGGLGFASAALGLVYGVAAMVPASALVAAPMLRHDLADVTTNPANPPVILGAVPTSPLDVWPVVLRNGEGEDVLAGQLQDIVPRRYRISPAQVHRAAREVMLRNGWTIADELVPDLPDEPSRLHAVFKSPVLGLTRDFVGRISSDPVGALMDLRSSSRSGLQDIDSNAERIRSFLADVDDVLLETYGEVETVDVSVESEEEAPLMIDPAFDQGGPAPLPGFKPYLPEEREDPVDEDPLT